MVGFVLGNFEFVVSINRLGAFRAFEVLRVPGFVHCGDTFGFDGIPAFGTPANGIHENLRTVPRSSTNHHSKSASFFMKTCRKEGNPEDFLR